MKRYACVGGPLHGKMLTSTELRPTMRAGRDYGPWKAGDIITPGGEYGDHGHDYAPYNRQSSTRWAPTQVWLHRSMLG